MRKSQWLLVSLVLLALLPALAIGGDASSAGKPKSKHAQTLHAKHRASLVTQLEDAAKAAEDGEDKDGEEKDDGEEEEKKWWDEDDKEGLSNLVLVMFVIGFVIMAVAAVFFLVMAFRYDGETDSRQHGPMFYYVVFFVSAISAMTYYSMWTETAVLHIVEEDGERIVFPARYLDWLITTPLMLAAVSLFGNAPVASMFGLVGSDLLWIGALYVGAVESTAHKYFWWGVAVVFFVITIYFLFQELNKADLGRVSEYDADTLRLITYFIAVCWAFFPLLWLFGQEGTGSSSLPVQAAFTTLFDITAKLAFGLFIVFRAPSNEQAAYAQYSRQQYRGNVTSSAFV